MFPDFGLFKGKVVHYSSKLGLYSVEYEDGDNEDVSEDELDLIVIDKKSKSGKGDSSSKKKGSYVRKYRNGTEVAKVR